MSSSNTIASNSSTYSAPDLSQLQAQKGPPAATGTHTSGAVQVPGAFSQIATLTMDGPTDTRGLSTTTLLASLQALPELMAPPSMSTEEFTASINELADSLEEGKENVSPQEKGQVRTTAGSQAQAAAASANSLEEANNPEEEPADPSGEPTPPPTDTAEEPAPPPPGSTDAISLEQIANELGGLGISISNDIQAQNVALINTINTTTSTAIAGAKDIIAAGQATEDGALGSFLTSGAFDMLSVASTASATKDANEINDAETVHQTDGSVDMSEKATNETDSALSNPTKENLAKAKEANLSAKTANDQLADGSAVKAQNKQTIAANQKAIEKQESGNTTEANNALAEAKTSQTASSSMVNGKSAFAASDKAIAATEKYQKNPTPENKIAAEKAQAEATTANKKLPEGSDLRTNNEKTLDANETALNNAKAYNKLSPDKRDPNTLTTSNSAIKEAKTSHAATAKEVPKKVYVSSRYLSSERAMGAYANTFAKTTIFNNLGEQSSSMITASYGAQAATDQGNAKIQEAASGAAGSSTTATNTSLTSFFTLASSLREGSAQAAASQATIVSGIHGA